MKTRGVPLFASLLALSLGFDLYLVIGVLYEHAAIRTCLKGDLLLDCLIRPIAWMASCSKTE